MAFVVQRHCLIGGRRIRSSRIDWFTHKQPPRGLRSMGISDFKSWRFDRPRTANPVTNDVRRPDLQAKRLNVCRILLCAAVAATPAAAAPIATASATAPAGSGARLKSILEFRDENLIRQQYDYSCGAAALATLLRFGLGDPVTEQQIVADLFAGLAKGDAQAREKDGFSLFDLQQVAKKRGYQAEGFRLEPQYIAQLNGPVIVFLETLGYKHFAVLKGVRGDRVYLADPSRGNIRMPAYRFLQAWMREGTGIVFVIEPNSAVPSGKSVLRPPVAGLTQPEIIGVRELLAVRAPFARN